MKVEPTAEVPQEEPLGEDAAPIEKLVGRKLTKAQQKHVGQAMVADAMLECQDSEELHDDAISMNTNAALLLALLLTMVASPDAVEPRDGNVWAANDFSEEAIETVIGTVTLLYFLTATLCMSGIFFSVFQMAQLAQIKKKLTKTYMGQVSWSVSLAIGTSEVVMHVWFLVNLLQISLTQRPWVLVAACSIYLLLFFCLTTLHLRMKQSHAKVRTNGMALLELKQELEERGGALPSEIQDLLDKPPTSALAMIKVQLGFGKGRKKAEKTTPQSLAALLAACGLEHHTSAFEAESYTLGSLLGAMKQGDVKGDEAAMRDLRELKLSLGDCRKIIHQLK